MKYTKFCHTSKDFTTEKDVNLEAHTEIRSGFHSCNARNSRALEFTPQMNRKLQLNSDLAINSDSQMSRDPHYTHLYTERRIVLFEEDIPDIQRTVHLGCEEY